MYIYQFSVDEMAPIWKFWITIYLMKIRFFLLVPFKLEAIIFLRMYVVSLAYIVSVIFMRPAASLLILRSGKIWSQSFFAGRVAQNFLMNFLLASLVIYDLERVSLAVKIFTTLS